MIRYKSGFKFQLVEDAYFRTGIRGYDIRLDFLELDPTGVLCCKRGYAWDGATGAPDFKWSMQASLVHDALYQLIRLGKLPKSCKDAADGLLRKIMTEDGAPALTPAIYWTAVHCVGSTIGLGKERSVEEAP